MPERIKIQLRADEVNNDMYTAFDRRLRSEGVEEPQQTKIEARKPVLRADSQPRYCREPTDNPPQKPQNTGSSANFKLAGKLRRHAELLLVTRQKLPIWPQAHVLKQSLRQKDILLLVGETGSGKSTQVPQFLVNEPWCKRQSVNICNQDSNRQDRIKVGGCIAVTEPRRVSTISLARRVADESGTPFGSSSASTVGYSVRFDKYTSPNTRIKFLTEGMLLQEMLQDPWLRQYSAVVVDEVHERSVNVDLILGSLKNIVITRRPERGRVPLKVVVMSATADLTKLEKFFCRERLTGSQVESSGATNVSICHIKGRQFPVRILYSPSPVHDVLDAALRIIFQINFKEPLPGDILVFLTGQETVESLEKLVTNYAHGLSKDVPKLLVLPLFAALPQSAQQNVFEQAPLRTRKVIISTNIAETSVTVPGVRHVIDCGKSKHKHFRTQIGLESLLCKPISKNAAIQRAGRAGREAPGTCYRLYTETAYAEMAQASPPEILRCDLAEAILTMKAQGVDKPWQFPFLDTPIRESMESGLLQLYQLGALQENGMVTEIGLKLARLPLSVPLGRVLLAAAEPALNCLEEVIDIISCLSVEAIFIQPVSDEGREKAAIARAAFLRREGDHLTLLAAMQSYSVEQSDRKAWCERHWLSHRAMRGAWDVRKQLREQMRTMGLDAVLGEPRHIPSAAVLSDERAMTILRCLLVGFATKTAILCPDGIYRTTAAKHEIAIHPSSVLFGRKIECILYNDFIFTNKSYARTVSVIQADWMEVPAEHSA